jgi:anti-anti-sigma factor
MFPVEKQGAVSVVRVQSPLTSDQCQPFMNSVLTGLGAGRPMLVVDMQNVPLIDSKGLETLVELGDRIERRGGAMKLAAANPLCSDILRVTGVGERFEIHSQVKPAVASFAE